MHWCSLSSPDDVIYNGWMSAVYPIHNMLTNNEGLADCEPDSLVSHC